MLTLRIEVRPASVGDSLRWSYWDQLLPLLREAVPALASQLKFGDVQPSLIGYSFIGDTRPLTSWNGL